MTTQSAPTAAIAVAAPRIADGSGASSAVGSHKPILPALAALGVLLVALSALPLAALPGARVTRVTVHARRVFALGGLWLLGAVGILYLLAGRLGG